MQPNQQQPEYWLSENDKIEANQPEYAKSEQEGRPLPDVSTPEVEAELRPTTEPIAWQASEYIHHEKQTMWFVGLIGVSLLLLVTAFVIQSWSFAVLVVVMSIAVSFMALRPPRAMNYQLTAQGLQVNEKHFSYHDFRSFGIINEGALYSVLLTPNKRFMPQVTMYFPPELGEQIVDLLGAMLPMEEVELDPLDKLVRKLRF